MDKTLAHLKTQLVGIRDGNLSSAVVETVKVDYNGQLTELKNMASVSQKDRRISIYPYDPSSMGEIQQALKKHGFDSHKFSKQEMGVNVPPPSGEEREKTIAHVKRLGEEAKIAVRNIRKQHKTNQSSEDQQKSHDKKLQEATDQHIRQIDEIIEQRIAKLRN